MCITASSPFFWIAIALVIGLSLGCLISLCGLARDYPRAATGEERAQLITDNLPVLVINGLWVMIVLLAANACGF